MMELQARDREILAFISNVKVVTIRIIHDVFFRQTATSTEACRRRLQKLTQAGYLQMFKDGFGREHLYRLTPRESREVEDQRLTLARFYAALKQLNIPIIKEEFYCKYVNVVMDATLLVQVNDEKQLWFVQSNRLKPFPTKKVQQWFSNTYYDEEINQATAEYSRLGFDVVKFVSLSDFPASMTLNIKPIRIGTEIKDLSPLIGSHAPLD